MLPEVSAEGSIPTQGEKHSIDLLYNYHMNNGYTCNITACTCKRGLVSAHCTRFSGPFIMEFISFLS